MYTMRPINKVLPQNVMSILSKDFQFVDIYYNQYLLLIKINNYINAILTSCNFTSIQT